MGLWMIYPGEKLTGDRMKAGSSGSLFRATVVRVGRQHASQCSSSAAAHGVTTHGSSHLENCLLMILPVSKLISAS